MRRTYRIALLPGDGIGPEVVAEAVRVLRAVESRMPGVAFAFEEFSVGAGEYLPAAIRCRRRFSSGCASSTPSCSAPWACPACAGRAAWR